MLKNKLEFIEKDAYFIMRICSKTFGKHDVLIDKEDVNKVKDIAWHINKTSQGLIYIRGKFKIGGKYKNISIHRYLMNCPKEKVIDHINRNTLDNRKQNLKICTMLENNQNKIYSKNKTGNRNICFDGYGYYVTKQYNKKYHYLGYAKTIEDAKKIRENFNIAG